MSEREIYLSYKNAKYPKSQIRVLAELNDKSPKDIKEIILRQQTLRAKQKHESEKDDFEECETVGSSLDLIFKRLDELDALINHYTHEYLSLVNKLKGIKNDAI